MESNMKLRPETPDLDIRGDGRPKENQSRLPSRTSSGLSLSPYSTSMEMITEEGMVPNR